LNTCAPAYDCNRDIEITPFTIPHDAADPVGYCFRSNGIKVVIVTDLGYMPELVKQYLRETDFSNSRIESRPRYAEG